MITWQCYPRSKRAPTIVEGIVGAFREVEPTICSPGNKLRSDGVLAAVRPGLERLGFKVELGKKADQQIKVAVLFGKEGAVEKSFEADAFDEATGTVIEVEAGRAVANNQFLKDLFQACMMQDARILVITVRNLYEGGNGKSHDFDRVISFIDSLYASDRLKLPLEHVAIIGY